MTTGEWIAVVSVVVSLIGMGMSFGWMAIRVGRMIEKVNGMGKTIGRLLAFHDGQTERCQAHAEQLARFDERLGETDRRLDRIETQEAK